MLEQVEEDNDQHRESEENLKKIIEQEDPEEGTEAGDEETDEIPLVEKFKQATKIFAELKPSLEPNITMKLTAFEMQSILGDCDSNTVRRPSPEYFFPVENDNKLDSCLGVRGRVYPALLLPALKFVLNVYRVPCV